MAHSKFNEGLYSIFYEGFSWVPRRAESAKILDTTRLKCHVAVVHGLWPLHSSCVLGCTICVYDSHIFLFRANESIP